MYLGPPHMGDPREATFLARELSRGPDAVFYDLFINGIPVATDYVGVPGSGETILCWPYHSLTSGALQIAGSLEVTDEDPSETTGVEAPLRIYWEGSKPSADTSAIDPSLEGKIYKLGKGEEIDLDNFTPPVNIATYISNSGETIYRAGDRWVKLLDGRDTDLVPLAKSYNWLSDSYDKANANRWLERNTNRDSLGIRLNPRGHKKLTVAQANVARMVLLHYHPAEFSMPGTSPPKRK
ncbi:hypothetical protein HOC01_04230 [archaeon]|jgi:hypothetical protein|nr:hypothetical protein [archaeon]MBT6698381.1 hypothetical protein [archaeon]